jgi:ATP adenylyltransferase
MGYILATERPAGCIFCDQPAGGDDARHFIVGRATLCYAILNRYPYNNGHLLIVPYRHVAVLEELTGEEFTELFALVKAWTGRLRKTMNAHGFNIGLNLGTVAGAGIADHLHVHVVPRWNGDTNFMAVLGDSRVISQSLQAAYDLLAASPT